MSWVRDTVSLGAIEEELKRRQGTKYPWGEYKREPAREACQCRDCQSERDDLITKAQKRDQELSCPERISRKIKDPEQDAVRRGYSMADSYAQMMFGHSIFFTYSSGDNVWSEVTREADDYKPVPDKDLTTHERNLERAKQAKPPEPEKQTARTPMNTVKQPVWMTPSNKKKRNRK